MGGSTQLRGDEAQLYEHYARRLEQVVGSQVHSSHFVVEEACANAWMILLRCQPARQTAWAWLKVVAIREAWRLDRQQRRALPIDLLESEPVNEGGVHERAEFHAELARLNHDLDARKRRILWLSVIGFTYVEIAEITGDSLRTVERQLLRARRTAREGR